MMQGEDPMLWKPLRKKQYSGDSEKDARSQSMDVWTRIRGLSRQFHNFIGYGANTVFRKCLAKKVTIPVCVLIIIALVSGLIGALIVIGSLYLSHPGSAVVCSSGPPAGPVCLDNWVRYRGKCYYFSEVEGNWTNSQTNCSGFRASLAVFDSEQEKSFLLRYINKLNHWLGLRREQGQPWKRVNGTEFNLWFDIKGGGNCAYLSATFVGSSRCSSHAHWICSKQDAYTAGKGREAKDINI